MNIELSDTFKEFGKIIERAMTDSNFNYALIFLTIRQNLTINPFTL